METDMRGRGKASRGRGTLRGLRRAANTADEMMARAGALLRRACAWTETPGARAAARFGATAGRAGYVAKGALYCVVGGLAIDAGVRPYDPLGGARSALVTVQRQWMGQAVVGVLAAGLAAYVLWQLVQAVLDPLGRARGVRGLGFRAVCVVSAALYGTLALQGVRLLAGATVDEEQRRRAVVWMRAVLAQPMGRWALLAIGLAVLAYAARQVLRAWHGPARSLDLSEVSAGARRRVVRLASAGLAARGIVAGIIAWFILRASVLHDPTELVGVAGALRVLRDHEHGPTLLVLMGAGPRRSRSAAGAPLHRLGRAAPIAAVQRIRNRRATPSFTPRGDAAQRGCWGRARRRTLPDRAGGTAGSSPRASHRRRPVWTGRPPASLHPSRGAARRGGVKNRRPSSSGGKAWNGYRGESPAGSDGPAPGD